MKIIDISVSISSKIPTWPKVPKPRFSLISSLKKRDVSDDTKIEMSIHTGTHIDAPSHFLTKGKSTDKLPLKTFIGPAFVASLPKVKEITAEDLEKLNLPKGIKRLLFKTSNSLFWKKGLSKFQKNYVGLTEGAALWLSKRGIKLVGIDYISIAKFSEAVPVHQILLKKEIVILEGLDLSKVRQGTYKLICFPVKISNIEAALARAVLIV